MSSRGRCAGKGRRAGLCGFDRGLNHCGDDRRGRRDPLGPIGFQRLDCQLKLLCFARQLLRGAAELGAPVSCQLEAQLGDLGLSRDRILRHRGDDLLQGLRVIGKLSGRDPHPLIESHSPPFGAAEPLADSLCRASAGQHRLRRSHRPPPVDAFQQHRQLRRRRPEEPAHLQFGPQLIFAASRASAKAARSPRPRLL
jgi:hypothetical protein